MLVLKQQQQQQYKKEKKKKKSSKVDVAYIFLRPRYLTARLAARRKFKWLAEGDVRKGGFIKTHTHTYTNARTHTHTHIHR